MRVVRMPWSIADTEYDSTHPWDSMFNGVPVNELLRPDPRAQALMNQAAATGSLSFPDAVIRETMTNPPPSPQLVSGPQPTIETVLNAK